MKLIVGLGNPGESYRDTKHNAGFGVTDRLAYKYNAKLKRRLFDKARTARLSMLKEDMVIVQPLTYMNLSGSCVSHFYKKLRLQLKDLLIICDDINLPLGKMRIKPSGSAGGHNGLASIINSLGSEEFSRLRIGIGDGQPVEDLSGYVLSKFPEDDEERVNEIIDAAVSACETWIKDGIEAAMNKFN
jgi:peptidyl-tRNA hydrolase, PTH1 family